MDETVFLWLNGFVGRAPAFDAVIELVVSDYLVPVTLALTLLGLWFACDATSRSRYQYGIIAAVFAVALSNGSIEILNNFVFRDRPFRRPRGIAPLLRADRFILPVEHGRDGLRYLGGGMGVQPRGWGDTAGNFSAVCLLQGVRGSSLSARRDRRRPDRRRRGGSRSCHLQTTPTADRDRPEGGSRRPAGLGWRGHSAIIGYSRTALESTGRLRAIICRRSDFLRVFRHSVFCLRRVGILRRLTNPLLCQRSHRYRRPLPFRRLSRRPRPNPRPTMLPPRQRSTTLRQCRTRIPVTTTSP